MVGTAIIFLLALAPHNLAAAPLPISGQVSDEPEHTVYWVTSRDCRQARKAGKQMLEYLYGDQARAISRFNRLDPKFVRPGRKLKIPKFPVGITDYQPMPLSYESGRPDRRLVLIVLDMQFLGSYQYGRLLASYPISSGKRGNRTPQGDFRVTRRHRDHKSSKYPEPDGGSPMPWAIRFYGYSYWIHQGDLPGYPASHGCVRLLPGDAKTLYRWVRKGTRVIVVRSLRQ